MAASGGEHPDSDWGAVQRSPPITVARQSRVRTGFPRPLDDFQPSSAIGGRTIRARRACGSLAANQTHGSVDREVGERPTRARHCDRGKLVARTPCSHWREPGRRNEKLGSQEPSLRSLHQALEERGLRMQAVSVSRVCALCTVLFSLAVLPATASATATDEEIDTAVAAAIEYVRDGQMPETGEPGDPESGIVFEKNNRFSSDWIAIALAAAGASSADVYDEVPGPPAKPGPSLQDFLLTEYSGNGGFWAGPPAWLPDTYERPAMVAHAAGLDPARTSAEGYLAAQVAGRWNPLTGRS